MNIPQTRGSRLTIFLLLACCWSGAVSAQDNVGRAPIVATGEVGQRLTREEPPPSFEPLGRVQSRVQNRIQSRLRNRIDRFYDSTANATSPFQAADDQARVAGRSRTR